MNDNEEFIQEFLEESDENLDQLDRDFVALESDPGDRDRLSSVFRTIHTIKGTSGFFGFSKLGSIAHAAENLLGRLRDGELRLDEEITSALLQAIDVIREILANIQRSGKEGGNNHRNVSDQLTRLLAKPQDHRDVATRGLVKPAPATATELPDSLDALETDEPTSAAEATRLSTNATTSEAVPAISEPEDVSAETRALETPVAEPTVAKPRAAESPAVAKLQTATGKATDLQVPPPGSQQTSDSPTTSASGGLSEGSIRVDVGLLNKLMNTVGELVLARNQLLQFTRNNDDRPFLNVTQRLNLIATELQEGVMKTRMQPISNVWGKFPRVVRDLAVACGKEIQLEMEGAETELDRSLVEAIRDPLTHLVRNAVDHGIELPAERERRGKPRVGHLLLRAFHEGGRVNIEITDDGGGIDTDRLKQKALDQNLITREQAAALSDQGLVNLIFAPGFTTAAAVTDISGRGVGMDVVKTNIEKIGGTIEIQNRPGRGMAIQVKIPLTLAIIPALIVTSGGDRYAIPQVSLQELLSFSRARAEQAVEMIYDAPVLRLRGRLLPLVFFNRVLQNDNPKPTKARDTLHVVVLNSEKHQFGLVVDEINNTEEIVVKPLHEALSSVDIFSGATILGDGQVALILDVGGVTRRVGLLAREQEQPPPETEANSANSAEEPEGLKLLLCDLGGGKMAALPLNQITRLEEFSRSLIEQAAGADVVQYRGEILPLRRLPGGVQQLSDESDSIQVVVSSHGGRTVGFVVDKILDVIPQPEQIRKEGRRDGVIGSVVIDQRVTDILDVPSMMQT